MNDVVSAANISFRAATAADVGAIVALVESAYRGDSGRRGWTTESDLLDGQRTDPDGVAAVIAKPGNRVLLAHREGFLLTCAHIEKQDDACYFGMFAVNPDLQGGGVGKQMMQEAERIARDEYKCGQMEMTVISIRNDLIAWYERRGYKRTGVYKPFPYGDERYGIPKRDDLRFELLVKNL